MQNDDIKVYLNDEEIKSILNFINENNYSVGEVEADKLLEHSPKLNHMFNIIYLADKLVKVSNFNNLATLLEIYSINTGHEQIIDIDDFSSNRRYVMAKITTHNFADNEICYNFV